jgi:hypothetical protein
MSRRIPNVDATVETKRETPHHPLSKRGTSMSPTDRGRGSRHVIGRLRSRVLLIMAAVFAAVAACLTGGSAPAQAAAAV